MLKKDLLDLVATQRARISQLETQLAATRAVTPSPYFGPARREAIARLHALYPSAKSFTAAEVATEIACHG